jgi:hypothetical protein
LIIWGDEDDACVEPGLLLKKHLSAAGLTNEMVERFIALVESSRWGVHDPRSIAG